MIEVKNLNKTYDRGRAGDRRVLRDVSFSLPDTGFVCILGPSGCGKTSLLNAIGGLDRFDSGTLAAGTTRVSRYGTSAYEAERNRNFGYIFQNYYLLDSHSVGYNVYLGLHSLDLTHSEKLRRVRMALQAVDMERFIRRRVSDLSGGQQQRVAIARALARRPKVIFADEPTGNLDEANTRNICTLLRQASRESLVIMVTHEEHIANFFADRIIRLDQGVIRSDSESWEREDLALQNDKELYAGDFLQSTADTQQVRLRVLQTEGAEPVELTVIAAKDRIILKLSDSRAITLASDLQPPKIIEGNRPVMTLETVDRAAQGHSPLFLEPAAGQCRAGKGLGASMMARESLSLMRGKGLKRASARVFLVLLTVLTLLTAADFITVSKVDPQDFITADSHVLQIKLSTGDVPYDGQPVPDGYYTWFNHDIQQYIAHLTAAPVDFQFMPLVDRPGKYTVSLFHQMNASGQEFPACSFVPARNLPAGSLLCGREMQNPEEVVVDKLVLDAIFQQEGILQNSLKDYSSFLGEVLDYGNKGLNPVIVGVCDSGERSIYATESALFTLGVRGCSVITVSELKARYPGEYDLLEFRDGKTGETVTLDLEELTADQCVANLPRAGEIWRMRIGQPYSGDSSGRIVQGYIENTSLQSKIIVADAALESMILGTLAEDIHLWCPDKDAVKAFLAQKTQAEQDGHLRVTVRDPYEEKYAAYQQAATIRADARTIVSATVLVLSMVMLYLLCRTRVNERLGLIAVYRLLGIPGRKLHGIFLLEGMLVALTTVLPTGLLTWLGVKLAAGIPELESALELPWQAAALAGAGILLYYLAVTALPLARLLRLPPAQLAAKYDM